MDKFNYFVGIAMEAPDDITTQTDDAMNDPGVETPNTDDIAFDPENPPSGSPGDDEGNAEGEEPEDTDVENTQDESLGEDSTDEAEDETSTEDPLNSMDESNTPPDAKRKEILRDNASMLYNIIKSNIQTLDNSETMMNRFDDDIFTIKGKLSDCAEVIYEYITRDLPFDTYVTSLRKYTALKQVYDICIAMFDRYMKNRAIEKKAAETKKVKSD